MEVGSGDKPVVETAPDIGPSSERFQWTKESTRHLIQLVEKNEPLFSSNTVTRRRIWQSIADEMQMHGWPLNWEQCDTKWKSLKRTYNSIKEKNEKDGKKRVWEFYSIIEELLLNKPELNPVTTCCTLNFNNDETTPLPTSPGCNVDHEFVGAVRRPKKTPSKQITNDSIERRHREKMENQRRFLNLLEQLIEKLN